jgi:hypothetical protein
MKANSPIKFTRYDDLNSSNETGLKNSNKPITPPQPQPPPPPTRVSNQATSILKNSSVVIQSPQSPPPNDIKYSSPVPKYNASMMMKTRNFNNTISSTSQSDTSRHTSRIDMMKRKHGTQEVTQQILTSFPNANSKIIDCVLVYEKLADKNAEDEQSQRKTLAREAFFSVLKKEKIDYYEIEHSHNGNIIVFVLLNCSTDRLLEEAELTRHDMTLKNVMK